MIGFKRAPRPGYFVLLVLCLLAAFLIKPVQDRLDARLAQKSADPDLLYFGSPRVVKNMALGYDSLIADIYWMRIIQYYGRRDEADRRPVRYRNLAALLDITTTLDPNMLDVYRAGGVFLGEADPMGAGQPQEAIKLLDKGIKHHPEEWRLYFDKGFVYYWFMGDFANAGETWLAGSHLPQAPPWMGPLAAMGLSKSGAIETAKSLWRRQYTESTRADVRENARNHLNSIQIYEDLWTLDFYLDKHQKSKGRRAANLQELVRAGYLGAVPVDPSGVPYVYDPVTGTAELNPRSRVRLLHLPFDFRTAYQERLEKSFLAR